MSMSRSSFRFFTIIITALLTASFVFTTQDVFADKKRSSGERHKRSKKHVVVKRPHKRGKLVTSVSAGASGSRVASGSRHRRVIVTRPRPRPGKLVVNLPPRNTRIVVRNRPYYYWGGTFYYKRPRGYVVVGPPIGAIVPRLAIGFSTVWIGGIFYYYYGNVFYRRVPAGYVVVAPPVTSNVVLETPAVVQPAESASGRVSVIAARLNVRTGPSLANPILYQVKQNATLHVHGRDRGWLYVELPDGKYGWVMEKFTVLIDIPASG
ncbi:MAG: DUF6515 family protein [Thermodesulfobacteriota bacterium]